MARHLSLSQGRPSQRKEGETAVRQEVVPKEQDTLFFVCMEMVDWKVRRVSVNELWWRVASYCWERGASNRMTPERLGPFFNHLALACGREGYRHASRGRHGAETRDDDPKPRQMNLFPLSVRVRVVAPRERGNPQMCDLTPALSPASRYRLASSLLY